MFNGGQTAYSKQPCTDTGAPGCSATNSKDAARSSRYQQMPSESQQRQHTATPSATAATFQQPSSHGSFSRQQQQLRQPPVRYARNAPNLAGRAGPSAGLPQHACHPKWPGRGYPVDETTCTCVLPRTSVLCRLLVAMTVLLVFVQAVSCGMFFCVTVPISHSRSTAFVDYQDLVSDLAVPAPSPGQQPTAAALAQGQQRPLSTVPKLIPRIIHQTYRNGRLPTSAKSFMKTWAEVNGEDWQVRFYSDDAALTFVRREFPEYFEAYLNLPKDVERADFFRYMVVLRLGGAYADIDAECRQPLDSIIQPADTLLVGWDTEVSNATSAAAAGLARQRLIANWFFVAAAGHPVLRELCDHIARNAMSTFSRNSVRDTAERTGQAVWTDVVLRHALQHKAAKHDDPWKVRILPRVAFGVRPVGDDAALRPDTPGVVVLHHFMSSWQASRHRRLIQALVGPLLSWSSRGPQLQDIKEPAPVSNITHYPVSITFDPPFTLMTDLVGLGDMQAAADVSAVITAHGSWQPGVAPYRKPAVVEALVGALAKHSRSSSNSPVGMSEAPPSTAAAGGQGEAVSTPVTPAGDAGAAKASTAAAEQAAEPVSAAVPSSSAPAGAATGSTTGSSSTPSPSASPGQLRGGVLVDVGAGQGFFSLAAAARGHRVIAFEASPASLDAFRAGIAYNGFEGLISVRPAALGTTAGAVCLQQADRHGCPGAVAAAKLAAKLQHKRRAASNATDGSNSTSEQQEDLQELQSAVAQMQLRRRRGYPWLADGAGLTPHHACCTAAGSRLRLSDVLRNASDVVALRISAHGHEGFILQGALEYLREVHKPDVVYVEFWPAAMRAAGYTSPVTLVQSLYDLGYTDIAHAGRVCDVRWQNATQGLHLQGSYSSAARAALQQPTWCKLRPEQFHVLADAADASVPENVMFLLGQSHSPSQPSSSSSSSSNAVQQPATAPGSEASSSSVPAGDSMRSNSVIPNAPAGQLQGAASGDNAASLIQQRTQAARPPSLALVGTASSGGSRADGWQPQQPL